MTFSYTQISQYLRCPRSYRYKYLDGWMEEDSRAAMCFGRCFEKALAALFQGQDPGAVLFKEWEAYREAQLEYSHGDDWERVLRQGIGLLERLAQDNRIRQPQHNLQKKLLPSLPSGGEFVADVGTLIRSRSLRSGPTTSQGDVEAIRRKCARPPEAEAVAPAPPLQALELIRILWFSRLKCVSYLTTKRSQRSRPPPADSPVPNIAHPYSEPAPDPQTGREALLHPAETWFGLWF